MTFDGTNTRLRVRVAPCLEVLVDLPIYETRFGRGVASGFTNVVPAVKWQISSIPEKFDLSTTVGLGLPTAAAVVAGSGAQPYVQFPWSLDIGGGWAITGMVTNFFTPADPMDRYTNQSTLVIERLFNERTFLFAEHVGEFPIAGSTRQLFNSAAAIGSRKPSRSTSIWASASIRTRRLSSSGSDTHTVSTSCSDCCDDELGHDSFGQCDRDRIVKDCSGTRTCRRSSRSIQAVSISLVTAGLTLSDR